MAEKKPRRKGGGKGKGKGDGGGGQKLNPWLYGDVQARAEREAQSQIDPLLDALARERSMAERDAQGALGRSDAAYDALAAALAPLAGSYDAQAQKIAADLQAQIGGLSGLIGSAAPSGELAAASGLLGGLGAGGLQLLASDRMRNLGYQTSAQRQGAIERVTNARNISGRLEDLLADIGMQRRQVMADLPRTTRSILDQLRDQRFEQVQVTKEFNLRKKEMARQRSADDAFRQFLEQQLGVMLAPRPGRRRKKGGGGFGGGGGGSGAPKAKTKGGKPLDAPTGIQR